MMTTNTKTETEPSIAQFLEGHLISNDDKVGTITDGEPFWLTDTASSIEFYNVYKDGSIFNGHSASKSLGVRPLITVVKD